MAAVILALARIIRSADGVPERDPEIEQAEATDDAANRTAGYPAHQRGRTHEKRIVIPGRGIPGREADQQPQINADDDTQESLGLLKPVR